jgi:hypothetical protein
VVISRGAIRRSIRNWKSATQLEVCRSSRFPRSSIVTRRCCVTAVERSLCPKISRRARLWEPRRKSRVKCSETSVKRDLIFLPNDPFSWNVAITTALVNQRFLRLRIVEERDDSAPSTARQVRVDRKCAFCRTIESREWIRRLFHSRGVCRIFGCEGWRVEIKFEQMKFLLVPSEARPTQKCQSQLSQSWIISALVYLRSWHFEE